MSVVYSHNISGDCFAEAALRVRGELTRRPGPLLRVLAALYRFPEVVATATDHASR